MSMSPRLLRPKGGYVAPDADARAYISSVETADGQKLETGVARAINDFVAGCKSDGTWTAIKASCILMGARTLSGALKPLVGTSPTNNNFVAADYNRKTGLVGDGSTKYLDSNRQENADPQDNCHVTVFIHTAHTTDISRAYFRANVTLVVDGLSGITASALASHAFPASGYMFGLSRASSAEYTRRLNGASVLVSNTSTAPSTVKLPFYQRSNGTQRSNGRLSFYSIGESLDLTKLDTRVTALYTAIGAAI